MLISGDFNHVNLEDTLAAFHQCVGCNTRGTRIMDPNVKDAYGGMPLPALQIKSEKTAKNNTKWSPEAEQALKDCFEKMD